MQRFRQRMHDAPGFGVQAALLQARDGAYWAVPLQAQRAPTMPTNGVGREGNRPSNLGEPRLMQPRHPDLRAYMDSRNAEQGQTPPPRFVRQPIEVAG